MNKSIVLIMLTKLHVYVEFYQVDDLILDPFNQDYTVDVVLLHIGTLLASFQIKIVPAEAKEWQILYFGSPHEGIMVGEQEEFDAKIKGRCTTI